MWKRIPEDAILYTDGLYLSVNGDVAELYSDEYFCFYDLAQCENYVDGKVGGELLPPEKRIYATYMIMPYDVGYIRDNIVSVAYQDSFEVV